MPNWEELAKSMTVPFGGVSALQGSYAGQQYNQPQITPQMLAERLTRQVPQGFFSQPVNTQVTPELVEKAYGVAAPMFGATSKVASSWDIVKKAIESIPKYRHGGLGTLTELHSQFPNMPKDEFDEMVLSLAREGKIALHAQDLPKGYKGEMIALPSKTVGDGGKIVDTTNYYHAFAVKPEWR